jgi:tetratricopeptide (TPR) repeat protein
VGNPLGVVVVLHNLGVTASYQGDLPRAQALLEESLELARALGRPGIIAVGVRELGTVARRAGDVAEAVRHYREALGMSRDMRDRWDSIACLEGLAAATEAQGQAERAVRLWSTATARREAIGAPLPPADRPQYEAALERLQATLREAAFAAAWTEGRAMTLEQAIAYALAAANDPASERTPADSDASTSR